jgi:colicin import membrane protein
MEALTVEYNPNNMMEPKWGKMLVISLFFHLAIFSIILFAPQDIPTRRIGTAIYEVNLVEMPKGRPAPAGTRPKATPAKKVSAPKKPAPAKRISRPKKKAKPIVVAKRTVKTKRLKPKKTEIASAKLIDQALSKIEKRIQKEEKDREQKEHFEQALSKLENKFKGATESKGATERKGATGRGLPGGYGDPGINFSIYQMEVREKIKSNWSFPSAHLDPKVKKNLEAVVIVKVRNNGTILESWVKKRSSSVIFDQTVIKAIERSDPLPPFPEGYRKTHDEIEFTFNLSDLEND